MKDIINVLNSAVKVAVFVHVTADGDALGSALALKCALESNGKLVDLYLNEKISQRLEFLGEYCDCEYFTELKQNNYDTVVALDCADEKRFGKFQDYVAKHENCINIDHHFTNTKYANFNYVDSDAAATGEIIAHLFEEMKFKLNKEIASLLYVAISSDTGCFAYSNSTPKTHMVAAKLISLGIDSAKINRFLFNTVTLVELNLKSHIINNLKIFYEGKLAIAVITEKDLEKFGASYENTEGLVDLLRSIKGVEVGCLIKEKDGNTKGSIRTNAYVDAAYISSIFGGGGHIRAAGFSTEICVEKTLEKIVQVTENLL